MRNTKIPGHCLFTRLGGASRAAWVALAILAGLHQAAAQGTAFTYQGRLDNGTNPANGSYDLTFALYNASTGGSLVAGPLTNLDVDVSNGLFTVTEDFGAVYNGTAYWLQIGVRTNGGSTFTALTPLQELTPAPYAVTAENVTGTIPLSQLPATVALLSDAGAENFFAGQSAGNATLSGSGNTGVGDGALPNNTSGADNTANGANALFYNSSGSYNTAYGVSALWDNQTGNYNTADGYQALWYNTTGSSNTATGYNAMANIPAFVTGNNNTADGVFALTDDDSGANNTGIGAQALANNTLGSGNTALGYLAGNNITGSSNIDIGNQGLSSDNNTIRIGTPGVQTSTFIAGVISGNGAGLTNLTGSTISGAYNTATGTGALGQNSTGSDNSAFGDDALAFNNTGSSNTAVGVNALGFTGAGNYNTAIGMNALFFSSGAANTAVGLDALFANQTGYNNTAEGYQAIYTETLGADNVAIGVATLQVNATGSQNTAVGTYAFQNMTAGAGNVGLGYYAGNSLIAGSNNIYIGNAGSASDNNVIRIGSGQSKTIIAGGAVGINTSSPSQALEVNGNFVQIDGANAANGDGPIDAYIGGNGSGSDVQIGSMNSLIGNVAFYNWGNSTYMHVYCSAITVEGGADLAEPFDISSPSGEIPQGSVVVIDEENPGHLKVSSQAYDSRVAGVLSGANGINPGIQMQQQGLLEGGKNVALTGRVYVLADAANGPIKPGDLLTTSATPGHAMKVSDHARAAGAILGKAMSGLKQGQGMVLVLVTLQ